MDAALRSRLNFVDLDDASLRRFAALKPLADAHPGKALVLFYKGCRSGFRSRLFHNPSHMGAAKNRQTTHWSAIAAGKLDDAYLQSSQVIGPAPTAKPEIIAPTKPDRPVPAKNVRTFAGCHDLSVARQCRG